MHACMHVYDYITSIIKYTWSVDSTNHPHVHSLIMSISIGWWRAHPPVKGSKTCPLRRHRVSVFVWKTIYRNRYNGVRLTCCNSTERNMYFHENAEHLMSSGVIVKDHFDSDGSMISSLRREFDGRFSNPLKTSADRFVWDYWHVPGQYSLMRTPADAFFSEKLHRELESRILDFGYRELGCRGISPIWLSYYVNGHRQEFHTDAPHGPLAFVLSLTDFENKRFSGGETMLLQDHILSFWKNHGSTHRSIELPDILHLISPNFNRMTVFDPRIPHGVRTVEGVSDPREGRIVLHGWFTEPVAYFEGDIEEDEATGIINTALGPLYQELAKLPEASGILNICMEIHATGAIGTMTILANTLQFRQQDIERYEAIDTIIETIYDNLCASVSFAPAITGPSPISMYIPFIFD